MKDFDAQETRDWIDSFRAVLEHSGKERAQFILQTLNLESQKLGLVPSNFRSTPYLNTIPVSEQKSYPGDHAIEWRLRSMVRWNALALVIRANERFPGIGGHISTFASAATLYEVAFNHFFQGKDASGRGDAIFFQGHASPGMYARAFLEGRISLQQMENFRREFAEGGGLTSYPHPRCMPQFWEFPTVSMGLGPLAAVYQARFNRYLQARGILQEDKTRVWAFLGDGEMDEPESIAGLTLAAREKLDNLLFVVNCNLQRLDGPVRGNGKIIQELESLFLGAGWNVIKVIWGADWDPLLAQDHHGLLAQRMMQAVDGQYQKYSVAPGSYTRKDFFAAHPELEKMVESLSDEDIRKLRRGGHDPDKVYNAYLRATQHSGQPTVILAKTIKGYGLGEAGEGRNVTHQQKKLNEEELFKFRDRFEIPVSDSELHKVPFYRPEENSEEMRYLLEKRKALGGFVPKRLVQKQSIQTPDLEKFGEMFLGSGEKAFSTTMAFGRALQILLRDPEIKNRIVPIIPDEARTFGLNPLFRQIGIYSPLGQQYEPVDKDNLLYYHESETGQLLEEGITEAGSMAEFSAAGTAYATHGEPMIPFYIYYSMFGFQRTGDQMWAFGDSLGRGFLMGATAGRTTLMGEGLQHQDGHSHLLASSIPNIRAYHPAFAFELAVILQDGLKRMYENGEDCFYYITLQNENYPMPEMPSGSEEGVRRGLYKFRPAKTRMERHVHLFGSDALILEVLKAQEILRDKHQISSDVWSATSYQQLRQEALQIEVWNREHPQEQRQSYLQNLLEKEQGSFFALSDWIKMVPDQIAPWVPGGLTTLGTDGFGRSDTREALRHYFKVDAEALVQCVLAKIQSSRPSLS